MRGEAMSKGKFAAFTDDELYMLKRQAIESSYNIIMDGEKYNEYKKKMHGELLNQIIEEIRSR
jgi:predicted transposase